MFPQKKSPKNRSLKQYRKDSLRSPKTITLRFPMAWRWRTHASERALSFPFASASFAPAHEQPLPILQTYRTAQRAVQYNTGSVAHVPFTSPLKKSYTDSLFATIRQASQPYPKFSPKYPPEAPQWIPQRCP